MLSRSSRLVAAFPIALIAAAGAQPGDPPATESRPVEIDYHGTVLVDEFQWLEGPENGVTEEIAAWSDAQNEYTREFLDNIEGRDALESRLRELMEVPSVSSPRPYGNRYFYSRREAASRRL